LLAEGEADGARPVREGARHEAESVMSKPKSKPQNPRPILVDGDLLPSVPGINLPTVGPHQHVLLDDDQHVCRVIDDRELTASYADNNINTFKLRKVDFLTLDCDKETVDITYFNGTRAALLLGSISLDSGRKATQYQKSNGVIYPINDAGNRLLNGTNTPRLVAMRTWYHNEARRVHAERVEIAEIVHSFTEILGNNSGVFGGSH
jgi:hypothetical protein